MEGNGRPAYRVPGDDLRGPSFPASNEEAAYAAAPPGTGRRMAVLLFLLMLVPVVAAALVFPALSGSAFASAAEIDPAQVKWLSVRLLNRTELDGGSDVGPYYAAPEDVANLLKPLKAVPETDEFTGARGPWLGEYRVMLTSGRKGTIRLYWHRPPQAAPNAPATLRFQIGEHLYEGGDAAAVIAVAAECEGRGRESP